MHPASRKPLQVFDRETVHPLLPPGPMVGGQSLPIIGKTA
jgi:hypothetical protein